MDEFIKIVQSVLGPVLNSFDVIGISVLSKFAST